MGGQLVILSADELHTDSRTPPSQQLHEPTIVQRIKCDYDALQESKRTVAQRCAEALQEDTRRRNEYLGQ